MSALLDRSTLTSWAQHAVACLRAHGWRASEVGTMVVRRPTILSVDPGAIERLHMQVLAAFGANPEAPGEGEAARIKNAILREPGLLTQSSTLLNRLKLCVNTGLCETLANAREHVLACPRIILKGEGALKRCGVVERTLGLPPGSGWLMARESCELQRELIPRAMWWQRVCAQLSSDPRYAADRCVIVFMTVIELQWMLHGLFSRVSPDL